MACYNVCMAVLRVIIAILICISFFMIVLSWFRAARAVYKAIGTRLPGVWLFDAMAEFYFNRKLFTEERDLWMEVYWRSLIRFVFWFAVTACMFLLYLLAGGESKQDRRTKPRQRYSPNFSYESSELQRVQTPAAIICPVSSIQSGRRLTAS